MGSDGTVMRWAAGLAIALLAASPVRGDAFDACFPAPIRGVAGEEQALSIDTPDGRISATLAGPLDGRPAALVLMLHGYTGARNEIPVAGGEGMFARTARAFAERGIASLRIDFIGSGQSDGDWADTRFSGQARDAVRAAEALRETVDAPDAPLGVLGYSQGGLVALRAAAAEDPFDRLALWNPVMDPMTTYAKIFGRETILDGAGRHDQGADPAIVEGTRLRPGFFAEIIAAEPIADAARVTAPLLIVTGQRDPLVVDGAALARQIQAGRSAETLILDLDAGHDLGALRAPALLDQVIACTAGFLLSDAER
ncbi:MAG: alpha/beta fold hydrolase [Pseudomonadota bacterium]